MSSVGVGQVRPSVAAVAERVERLARSTWPTGEAERVAWFVEHGIAPVEGEFAYAEHGSESYRGAVGEDDWPKVGWHVHGGEFVGVFWFLWAGLPGDVVVGFAHELADLFTDLAGEPVERHDVPGTQDCFTAYWEVEGRCIDMYLHGGPALGGELVQDPVVQLHVDHVERSARAEAAARAAESGRPSGHALPNA